ncbi:MAG: PLP-dependent transferase [Microbacteriaceae bacterium]|nr:PLP-dependent transferase [Microbacteriaceae bacterium]
MNMPYAEAVGRFAAADNLRLNIPGHGADHGAAPELMDFFGAELLRRDITPLLHGIDMGEDSPLAEALTLAARAWGARRTWFLTNGASQANRIGALAFGSLGHPNQPVLVQRSAHSSFIDGIILGGLLPVFMQPRMDERFSMAHGVTPATLEQSLAENADVKGVYVVTPSYFGAVSDVRAMARIAHDAGVPLMVDGAWGAHFGFHPDLPDNPLALGADLVVSSTHKLGGSLTQSAMLHLADGPFADVLEPLIQRAAFLCQSTSTSSLLLASLDIARYSLENGHSRIGASIASAAELRASIREGGRFGIVSDTWNVDDIVAHDPLRVSIDVRSGGLNGRAVQDELVRAAGIYTEISTDSCIVAFIGPGFKPDNKRLLSALHALEADGPFAYVSSEAVVLPPPGALDLRPREAWFAPTVTLPADQAVGHISTDSLAAYPPGVPNVLPGEVLTAEVVDFLRRIAATPGGYVRGAIDASVDTFRVVAE